MRKISEKEYDCWVATSIDDLLEDTLLDEFNRIAERFGFVPVDYDTFHSYYYDGYVGDIRTLVIKLFEWLGMDVEPEGGNWWVAAEKEESMSIAEECRKKVDERNKVDELIPAVIETVGQMCLRYAEKGYTKSTFKNRDFRANGAENPLGKREKGEELDSIVWFDIRERVADGLRREGFEVATAHHGYADGVMLVSW